MSGEFKCEYCEKEFERSPQLRGHEPHCRRKHEENITNSASIIESIEREIGETPERQERVSFGKAKLSFNAPKNDGYEYRVFNDKWRYDPDRIERAERSGWVMVSDSGVSGRNRGTNEDGSGIKGVLMRIPKELYDKDQEAAIKETEKVDEQIRAGKFTQQANEKRYSPSSGIKID